MADTTELQWDKREGSGCSEKCLEAICWKGSERRPSGRTILLAVAVAGKLDLEPFEDCVRHWYQLKSWTFIKYYQQLKKSL